MDYGNFEMTSGISSVSPQLMCGSTSCMSNTLCISDTTGEWKVVEKQIVQELSEFGEIARLDASLAGTLGTVLVTYFDVRCAQFVMMHMAPRAEPFQPAAHDCRTVNVDVAAFCEKTGNLCGFQEYGEVANVSVFAGEAIVEYYDLRSAQALLAAAGGSAAPAPTGSPSASPDLPATIPTSEVGMDGLLLNPSGSPGVGRPAASPGSRGGPSPMASPALMARKVSRTSIGTTEDAGSNPESPLMEKGSHRPVRTKIANKDFQKFDINPDAILRGLDNRTTVMVRHLQGVCARKEFLLFLEKCGLGNRYSFFYMPCKEHRNVPAGFAFVNFASPHDVHTLHGAVASGLWREVCGSSPTKSPAVSYARFQGHDDLVEHFSLSAVLHEQDPEKRPIFRPEVAKMANSVQDTVGPMKIGGISEVPAAPPGISMDLTQMTAAEAQEGDAAAPISSSFLSLSSKQLQAAVQELLRKQGKTASAGDSRQALRQPASVAAAELENANTAAKIANSVLGSDEENFLTRMTGA